MGAQAANQYLTVMTKTSDSLLAGAIGNEDQAFER
jgi:hypothetical protein